MPSKKTERENKEKQEKTNLFGWANLVLTFIIGVVLAVFIQFRNEQVQKDLLQVQSQLGQQSQLAHLNAYCPFDCIIPDNVAVANTGPAISEGVVIIVQLVMIDDKWKPFISGLDDLELYVSQPYVAKPNATSYRYEIRINKLPPKAYAGVSVRLRLNNEIEVRSNEKKYDINAKEDVSIGSLYQEFANYWSLKHLIAGFTVYASCDNCEGQVVYQSLNLTNLIIQQPTDYVKLERSGALAKYHYLLPKRMTELEDNKTVRLSRLSRSVIEAGGDGKVSDKEEYYLVETK